MQTPDQTLARAIGSCRDSAWLLVEALRHFGLAARFVSGYLVQLASDDPAAGRPKEDFTDLHAWAEVYVPGRRLDRARRDLGAVRGRGAHPALGHPAPRPRRRRSPAPPGRPRSSSPSPTPSAGSTRTRGSPSRTRPRRSRRCSGRARRSTSGCAPPACALTMGGEPTFVSRDDMVSPQWTVAADGPEKRLAANRLAAGARRAVRPRRAGAAQPGQVVPGRAAAALADRADLAARRRRRSGATRPCWPTRTTSPARADATRRPPPSAGPAIAADLGLPAEQPLACYEDPLAALAVEVRQPEGRRRPELDPTRRRPGRGRRASTPTCSSPGRLGAADRAGLVRRRLGQPALADPPRPARARARRLPGRRAAAARLGRLARPGLRRRALLREPDPDLSASSAARRPSSSTRSRCRPGRRGRRRPATASCTSSCRRTSSSSAGSRSSRWSSGAAADRRAGRARGLRPAAGPADHHAARHPGPGRDRGQPAPDRQLGRS